MTNSKEHLCILLRLAMHKLECGDFDEEILAELDSIICGMRAAAREGRQRRLAAVTAQRDELLRAAKAVQELFGDDLDEFCLIDFRKVHVRDLLDAFVEAIARAQPEQPQQPKEADHG